MGKLKKAVIPIAGLGTRMLPATKAIPKEMLPIVGKPIIQYIVEEAVEAGFEEIILITHSSKYSVENHFDESFELEATLEKRVKRSLLKEIKSISKLNVIIQSVRQGHLKGLGHAVLCAKPLIQKEPFAIILPDMILKSSTGKNNLLELKREFDATGISQILLGTASKKDISKYGIAKVSKNLITKIIEKPSYKAAPSKLFVVGRYIFDNKIFDFLSSKKTSTGTEMELTESIQKFIEEGNKVGLKRLDGEFFDCGDKLGYLKAVINFALEDKIIGKELKSFVKRHLI